VAASSPKELNIIEQNVRLCRDLLTMWQSYGNNGGFKPKPISMSQIVREVTKGAAGIAAQNGVEFQSNVCQEPCVVLGDTTQLTRAVQNVIVNAIQACAEKKGTVTVTCVRKDFYVDILVEDTGSGIPSELMAKIFEPYFTTKQAKSGTGLGLYITKKVIEDHQGSIKVESTPEAGTTFTLRLPLLHDHSGKSDK
jgi:signal transduction histidine kinase